MQLTLSASLLRHAGDVVTESAYCFATQESQQGNVCSACLICCRLAARCRACNKNRALSGLLWQACLYPLGPHEWQLASKGQALVPETA